MELNLLLPCFGLSALFQLFVLANTWLCLKAQHHSTTVHKTCPNIPPPPFLSRYVFCIYALISPLSTLYPLSALSNIYFPLSTLNSPLFTSHSPLTSSVTFSMIPMLTLTPTHSLSAILGRTKFAKTDGAEGRKQDLLKRSLVDILL